VGASIGYVNTLVQLILAPNAVADGSPPGTVVGTLSVSTVFVGQYLPPLYRLPLGEAANAAFSLGATAHGTAPLLTRFPAKYAGQSSYLVRVHVDIGFGDSSAVLQVFVASPSGRIDVPRGLAARLVVVKKRKGKKVTTRLMVRLFYTDNGAVKGEFASPYQAPVYQGVQVRLGDSTGDGVPDVVVVTARKGKKKFSKAFSA
jgi:hypothetical protein